MFTVTNTNDAGAGSLRQAIIDSNAMAGADTINFGPLFAAAQTINLTTQMEPASTTGLLITDSLTIDASASARPTIAGNDTFRIFKISDGAATEKTVEFINLKITGGNANNETWANNFMDRRGGGIDNREAFTLRNSEISGNRGRRGGGLSSAGEGDNTRRGSLTVIDSVISGNTAQNDQIGTANTSGGRGGGIGVYNSTPVSIQNTTIQNNYAADIGGGVDVSLGVVMTINKGTTISGNSAPSVGAAMYVSQFASANTPITTVTLDGVTVSGNTSGKLDVEDVTGILALGQGATLTVQNSMLTNNKTISESTKYFEAMFRAQGGTSGASTFNILDTTISGNTAADGLVAWGFEATGTMRNVDIINNSMVRNAGTIYDPNTGIPVVISQNEGGIVTIEDSTISGNSSQFPFFSDGAISAGDNSKVVVNNVDVTNNVNLGGVRAISGLYGSKLEIRDSRITGNSLGGVVGDNYATASYGSDIEIVNSVISNNGTDPDGSIGGIYLRTAVGYETNSRLQLTRSTVSGNKVTGGNGGGIHAVNFLTINIDESTIDGNQAVADSAGMAFAGGGMSLVNSNATITRSTISNSSASGSTTGSAAGGIFFLSDLPYARQLTIDTSTISGNTAALEGGGINAYTLYPASTVTIKNSTITLNSGNKGGGIAAEGYVGTDFVTMSNTIVSGNIDPSNTAPDIYDTYNMESFATGTFNLVGNNKGSSFVSPGVGGNKVGTPAAPLNALLGPLANNGGPTRTHLPATGSPAINMGDPAFPSGTNDQRLRPRPVGVLDIGSVEVQPVTNPCDLDGDGDCDIADLDMLCMAVFAGSQPPAAVDTWLADAATLNGFSSPYKKGDADLNGVVDGNDFITWNSNKFTASMGKWSRADFNCDGTTDGQDFILWNLNKFTSSDAGRPSGGNSFVAPTGATTRGTRQLSHVSDRHRAAAVQSFEPADVVQKTAKVRVPQAAPAALRVAATDNGEFVSAPVVSQLQDVESARQQSGIQLTSFQVKEQDRSGTAKRASAIDRVFADLDREL